VVDVRLVESWMRPFLAFRVEVGRRVGRIDEKSAFGGERQFRKETLGFLAVLNGHRSAGCTPAKHERWSTRVVISTYVSDEQASVILIQGQMSRTDTSGNSLVQHLDRPVGVYPEAEHLALDVPIAVDNVLVSPDQVSKARTRLEELGPTHGCRVSQLGCSLIRLVPTKRNCLD
jgi:hypothetical protein